MSSKYWEGKDPEQADGQNPYSVNYWGSKPGENDDCWTGRNFATKEEALKQYNNETEALRHQGVWVELDGPDIHEERQSTYKPSKSRNSFDHEWRSEFAMQAGMAGGCEAYNDAMGYWGHPDDY